MKADGVGRWRTDQVGFRSGEGVCERWLTSERRSSKPQGVVRRRLLKLTFVHQRPQCRRLTANDSQVNGPTETGNLGTVTSRCGTSHGFLDRLWRSGLARSSMYGRSSPLCNGALDNGWLSVATAGLVLFGPHERLPSSLTLRIRPRGFGLRGVRRLSEPFGRTFGLSPETLREHLATFPG